MSTVLSYCWCQHNISCCCCFTSKAFTTSWILLTWQETQCVCQWVQYLTLCLKRCIYTTRCIYPMLSGSLLALGLNLNYCQMCFCLSSESSAIFFVVNSLNSPQVRSEIWLLLLSAVTLLLLVYWADTFTLRSARDLTGKCLNTMWHQCHWLPRQA